MWFKKSKKVKKIKKPKLVTKRFTVTDERMEQYSKECEKTYPSDHFDKFVKGCCPEYDDFFIRNPTNRKGRFYGGAYMYIGGGNKKYDGGKEFTTLYDAYYNARGYAYRIDKNTHNTCLSEYAVEWEIQLLIDVEK